MPRHAMDYSKTIIYKIVCNDSSFKECYVGHTTNFVKRKSCHKSSCDDLSNKSKNKNKLYQMIREHGGWNNWSMTPICEHTCENYIQACIKEEECRIELQASLNKNKCYVGLPLVEYSKQYYQEHKEQIAEYKREYAEKNKEYLKEYLRNYQQEHKEQIAKNKKDYTEKHKKETEEYQKQWREQKKEIKKEYDRIYRQKKHQNFILNGNSNGEKIE